MPDTTIDLDNLPGDVLELDDVNVRSYVFVLKQATKVEAIAHSQGHVTHKPGVADMRLIVNGTAYTAHDYDFEDYGLTLKHTVIGTSGATISIAMTTSNGNAKEDVPNSRLKVRLTKQ